MTNKTIAGAVLTLLFSMNSSVQAQELPEGSECQRLGTHLQAGARAVTMLSAQTGAEGFRAFRQAVASSAKKAGDAGLASRVEALEPGKAVPSESSVLASCLAAPLSRGPLRRPDRRRPPGDGRASGPIAEEGRTNWDAPEFGKPAQVAAKARRRSSGFEFKSLRRPGRGDHPARARSRSSPS